MLVETIGKHVFHKKVYLIYGIELLDIASIFVLSDLGVISVSCLPDIKVLYHIIQCSLLPSIFDVPIEFSTCSFLDLFFVLKTVGVCSILSELALMPIEVLPAGSTSR
jgi:hypothetical protein